MCGLAPRLLWLLVLSIVTTGAAAETPPVNELHQIRLRIGEIEESLADDTIKFRRARDAILEIERPLHAARQEQEKFRLLLESKAAHIRSLRARRDRLNQSYETTRDAMRQTLVARFMLWRQPKLKVLFNNADITGLQRNLRYYDYVAAATNARLRDQSAQRRELQMVESALKLEASKLRQIRDEAEHHTNSLIEALAQRNRVAETLEKLLQQNRQALEQLHDDENELTDLVDEIAAGVSLADRPSTPFGRLKGELSWPTAGRITKTPGGSMRKGGAKWSGVIIESDPGSHVAAVAAGRVAFADWFRNLGLLVIIDHGSGYMSLYGHNRELYKHSGDWIDAGEIVATVGDTGGRSATGLYFEIRQNGVPQDPRQWCRK